jgi:hypothetical protein
LTLAQRLRRRIAGEFPADWIVQASTRRIDAPVRIDDPRSIVYARRE